MASTKTRALDAAIELLGTEGLRALTHARVDEQAGLPRGSTSNWFRTRDALFTGVCDHIVELESAAVTAQTPSTAAELVETAAALVEFTTGPNRTLTTARLVLFMEASHNPTLRKAIVAGRAAMEESLDAVLRRIGSVPSTQGTTGITDTPNAPGTPGMSNAPGTPGMSNTPAGGEGDVADPRSRAAAAALMGCAEGMILHRIARGDTTDPRPAFEIVVRGALEALDTHEAQVAIG